MDLSVRISCKGYFHPFFSLINGTFYPYCDDFIVIDLINEISERFQVFIGGYRYSLGINEKDWYKNYPHVAGIILERHQIFQRFVDIVENTTIPCISYNGKEIEIIATNISGEIKNLHHNPDRIIDIDIPIFVKDLDRLLIKLPKLRSITVKVNDISEIPRNITKDLIIRII